MSTPAVLLWALARIISDPVNIGVRSRVQEEGWRVPALQQSVVRRGRLSLGLSLPGRARTTALLFLKGVIVALESPLRSVLSAARAPRPAEQLLRNQTPEGKAIRSRWQ